MEKGVDTYEAGQFEQVLPTASLHTILLRRNRQDREENERGVSNKVPTKFSTYLGSQGV